MIRLWEYLRLLFGPSKKTDKKPIEEIKLGKPVEAQPRPVEKPKKEVVKHRQRYCWCIDPGHGKLTKGKRSPLFADGKTRLLEWEFNRDVADRIIKRLEELGIAYFDVMPDAHIRGNFLRGRVRRANEHQTPLKKIFLSIHANAGKGSGWSSPSGIETWHIKGNKKTALLARIFQEHLVYKLKWPDRSLKAKYASQSFYVLRATSMPAILTENGFYTNKSQARQLKRDDIRQKIADAHVAAILQIEQEGIL